MDFTLLRDKKACWVKLAPNTWGSDWGNFFFNDRPRKTICCPVCSQPIAGQDEGHNITFWNGQVNRKYREDYCGTGLSSQIWIIEHDCGTELVCVYKP